MANGEDDGPRAIEPGNGRILGAGSNNLQRSIDQLNGSVQRLLTSSGGSGGNFPPAVRTAVGATPEPQRPGGALVPRGDRFPVPVSWHSNDSGSAPTYDWGTPSRNQPAATPTVHRANDQPRIMPTSSGTGAQWVGQTDPKAYLKGTASSGWDSGTAKTAQRWIGRAQNVGNAMLKMALPMDNYAQWAAIQAGSPVGPDGTDGRTVNSLRKQMFGSQGKNQIMWAQNSQDASNAAFIASRNSGMMGITPGSTSQINPAFSNYMGGIKDLSVLNPMMNAADSANIMGTLTSTRGLYSAMMFGYKPVLGAGGAVDRNSLGAFSDSVMRSAYGKNSVSANNLKAGLGQNGVLNANIAAYVNAAGGDQKTTTALEDYISGRNTAAQRGVTGDQFDKLLNTYEAGGSGSGAAGKKLKNLGITNSILQSQKDLGAAKAENTSDLLDSFGPAIKKANEALGDFYGVLDRIVNLPGVKQGVGYTAGFASVFGGAANASIGGISGYMAGRSAAGGPGGFGGMSPTGVGAPTGVAGRTAGLSSVGVYGAAAAGTIASVAQGWSDGGSGRSSTSSAAVNSDVQKVGNPIELGTSQARRVWDKVKGKNRESWVGLLNPFGNEQRTTGNDGIGGGASNSATGGGGGGGSGTPSSGNVVNGKSAAGAISAAMAEIGKPYQWGGTGPDSWDCSGLMQHAYAAIGVRIPRVSEQQMTVGQAVDRKDVRPGDLMFPYSGHVVMYIGSGKIVEAPRTGENVRVASVSEYGRYVAIRRIVGAVGNLGDIGTTGTPQKQMANNAGGDSGSPVLGSGNYGSVEEVDAISSAMAAGAVPSSAPSPQGSSASSSNSTVASSSGPWKKDNASVAKAKSLGKSMAAQLYNWTGGEWDALDKLFTGESGWRWWADNPSSHAYGIVQSLPGSKMASAGKDWKTNPATQLKWGMKYIKDRYGDPMNAYSTWSQRSPHWYDKGAWNIPNDQIAMVHKGEMIVEKPKADTIRNALMNDVVNVRSPGSSSGGGGGQGMTILFQQGSVAFNVAGAMTEAQAVSAGTTFAQTLVNDDRLKRLAKGL